MSFFKQNIVFGDDNSITNPFEFLNTDANFPIRRGTIDDIWMVGNFRALSRQSIFEFRGNTYSLWYKEKEFSNQVGMLKRTGDNIVSGIVNNGTQGQEPINHPAPMAWGNDTNGHIYVAQNVFHVDAIRIYKSNLPEDVESGFTLLGTIGTDTSYLGLLENNGNDIVIQTRAGADTNDIYSMSVIKVNLETLAHEQIQITDSDWVNNDWRHYNLVNYQYDTSDKVVVGIAHRNQPPTGTGYYKFSALVTNRGGDYKTWTNIEGTFTKNIQTSGEITTAELESHFAVIGSDTARTTIISEGHSVMRGNDIYFVYMSDDANSRFSILKRTIGSATETDFLIPLETIAESPIWYMPIYMYDNGFNWVFSIFELIEGEYITNLYKSNYDFTGFQKVDVDTLDNLGYHYGIPINLHEVTGKYMHIGKDDGFYNSGQFIYAITEDKFLM